MRIPTPEKKFSMNKLMNNSLNKVKININKPKKTIFIYIIFIIIIEEAMGGILKF